jgi:GT2 family glycosyltransferase
MNSVLRMERYEIKENGRLLATISKKSGSGWIANARNWVTEEFLKSDSQWLMFIDADMGFAPYALTRMLSVAKSQGFKPIVGGLCFSLSTTDWDPETNGETFECYPTIGIWNRNDKGEILGYRYVMEYDKDAVLKVDSSGAAMLLIHRSVFEKIGTAGWWTPLEIPNDAPGLEDRSFFSEDVSFFIRLAEAGIDFWLDTGTRTSHDKHGIHVTEKTWDAQEAAKRAALEPVA